MLNLPERSKMCTTKNFVNWSKIKMKDEITIVVPCKNEESYIYYLLDSLKKQKGIEGIKIVIADCSTDNTRKVIENHT